MNRVKLPSTMGATHAVHTLEIAPPAHPWRVHYRIERRATLLLARLQATRLPVPASDSNIETAARYAAIPMSPLSGSPNRGPILSRQLFVAQ